MNYKIRMKTEKMEFRFFWRWLSDLITYSGSKCMAFWGCRNITRINGIMGMPISGKTAWILKLAPVCSGARHPVLKWSQTVWHLTVSVTFKFCWLHGKRDTDTHRNCPIFCKSLYEIRIPFGFPMLQQPTLSLCGSDCLSIKLKLNYTLRELNLIMIIGAWHFVVLDWLRETCPMPNNSKT